MDAIRGIWKKPLHKTDESSERYRVCYSDSKDAIPSIALKKWDSDIVSACTGPNAGLTKLDLHSVEIDTDQQVAGVEEWNAPNENCYGISLSFYEEDNTRTAAESNNPLANRIGDPIADVYGSVVRGNNTILAIADGCGWGKKPRLAARCAVRTAIEYTLSNTAVFNKNPSSKTLLNILMSAMEASHECILKHSATLTTISIAAVCETVQGTWGVFTACLGDSRAFIYSPEHQILMEASAGSHPSDGIRQTRNSGGALGPAIGSLPDFENLSFSFIPVSAGDIVVLMTDGVADNLVPKTIEHVRKDEKQEKEMSLNSKCSTSVPHVKIVNKEECVIDSCCQASCELHKLIREHHQSLQNHISPQTIALFLMNLVGEATEEKRRFHADCIEKGINVRTRELQDAEFADLRKKLVGKLDHATVLSYLIS